MKPFKKIKIENVCFFFRNSETRKRNTYLKRFWFHPNIPTTNFPSYSTLKKTQKNCKTFIHRYIGTYIHSYHYYFGKCINLFGLENLIIFVVEQFLNCKLFPKINCLH